DPWAARDEYMGLRQQWLSAEEFWARHGRGHEMPLSEVACRRAEKLLEAQYWGQAMYTSCGFFFEDLDRLEPRNDIAFARRAISLVYEATGRDLETAFVQDLAASRSWRTGLTGSDLYRQLPPVEAGGLPTPPTPAEPAA